MGWIVGQKAGSTEATQTFAATDDGALTSSDNAVGLAKSIDDASLQTRCYVYPRMSRHKSKQIMIGSEESCFTLSHAGVA